jgi:hypothetical protein
VAEIRLSRPAVLEANKIVREIWWTILRTTRVPSNYALYAAAGKVISAIAVVEP